MKLCSLLVFLSALLLPQLSYGDIVVYTFEGFVKAELENVVDPLTALLSGDVDASKLILYGPAKSSTENSITTSTLDYAWDGTTLSGSGFIDEQKTFAGKKGGLHQGESTLTFDFTIDETSTYDLTGNFGYVGVSPDTADTVSWTLTGTPLSGPKYSASGTATPKTVIPPETDPVTLPSVHDQLFSHSDTISAGSYTLVLTADFHETVNDKTSSREAGWEIQSFTVSPVPTVTAVPEPNAFVILAGFVVAAIRRRRSR